MSFEKKDVQAKRKLPARSECTLPWTTKAAISEKCCQLKKYQAHVASSGGHEVQSELGWNFGRDQIFFRRIRYTVISILIPPQ
jgi:hypothetical protein